MVLECASIYSHSVILPDLTDFEMFGQILMFDNFLITVTKGLQNAGYLPDSGETLVRNRHANSASNAVTPTTVTIGGSGGDMISYGRYKTAVDDLGMNST